MRRLVHEHQRRAGAVLHIWGGADGRRVRPRGWQRHRERRRVWCVRVELANSTNWVTIVSGSSGQGAGTVNNSVGTNPTTAPRNATLAVAGENITITQAATPCSFTVDPTSISADAAASSGTVNVTAQSGCPWTAASNANWITVTSGATGSGSGAAGYSIAANSGTSSRTGTLTIAGRTVSASGGTCGARTTATVAPVTRL